MIKNISIVDRVVERLKLQPLGDLITEEDLHDIVKDAIPKCFFEKRVTASDNYGRTVEKEPVIVEVLRELLREQAKEAVAAWMKDNTRLLYGYWKDVCDDGLMTYVQEIQNQKATATVKAALQPLLKEYNDEQMRRGLPMLYL